MSVRAALLLLVTCGLGSCQQDEAPSNAEVQPPAAVNQPGPAPEGMVWVPGGEFLMGDSSEHATTAEQPVHRVHVDGFYIDKHTVTNARFRAFVEATGYVTLAERAPSEAEIMSQLPPGTPPPDPALLVPGSIVFKPTAGAIDLRDWSQWWVWTPGASWKHPTGPQSTIVGKDDHPVVQVAWDDATAYAAWAGKRLPTEAEWEFAARGGLKRSRYAWGDDAPDEAHPRAHIYQGSFPAHAAAAQAVGSFKPNGYGLYDMAGNVWQWTLDWYRPDAYQHDLERGLAINPAGPSAGLDPASGNQPARVLRGGSYLCSDSYCRGYRVSARSPGAPDSGTSHIGFRTVMTVEQWTRRHAADQGDQR